jgi:hypothetical protein
MGRKKGLADKTRAYLDIFAWQGVATIGQVRAWYDVEEYIARNGLDRLLKEGLLGSRFMGKTWKNQNNQKRASRIKLYFLTDFGARELSLRIAEQVTARTPTVLDQRYLHSLGIIDICVILKQMNLPFEVERRFNLDSEEEVEDKRTIQHVKPDIAVLYKEARIFIEYEQSREKEHLLENLVKRMTRWQNLFSHTEPDTPNSNILVLFALADHDNYTLATWMKALDRMVDHLGDRPAFNVWYTDFSEFIQRKSLDLQNFTRLRADHKPQETFLGMERDQVFLYEQSRYIAEGATSPVLEKVKRFWQERQDFLQQREEMIYPQVFFLDLCDCLFENANGRMPGEKRDACLPWKGIGLVRYWLELAEFSVLRSLLIEALGAVKNYHLGLAAAADVLERMIWDVLLRFFGIGRGGVLTFYVNIGNSDKDRDRSSGLVPVFKLENWGGVRETAEALRKTENALTWLVTMLVHYQAELGLLPSNKKQKPKIVLPLPTSHEEDVLDDPAEDIRSAG